MIKRLFSAFVALAFVFVLEAGATNNYRSEVAAAREKKSNFLGLKIRLTNWLKHLGYKPVVDEAGDYLFKVQGYNVILDFDETDDTFFRLLLAMGYSNPSGEADKYARMEAAMKVMRDLKVIKVLFDEGGNPFFLVEQFVEGTYRPELILSRSLDVLMGAIEVFDTAYVPVSRSVNKSTSSPR